MLPYSRPKYCPKYLLVAAGMALLQTSAAVADDENHHEPNHIAFIVGHAEEEQADGHHQSGNVLGIEYIRHLNDRWAWGVAFEVEAFGDQQKRHGILAIPISYFPTDSIRLFVAPGVEFSEPWDPDKAMARLGIGYEFELGHHWSLAPEAQVDFVAGGTNVYVLALTLGYGF